MKRVDVSYADIEKFNKRRSFDDAVNFLEESQGRSGRILTLYGLRRTGKTVLMKQLACKYGVDHIYEAEETDTMKDVYNILDKEREENHPKMIFIDEITNAEDFIENSAILSDDYTTNGTDIIVAGTDSLGLDLAEDNALYDRTYKISMTYIPFAEHCELLGSSDIDEYIMYGGLTHKGIKDKEAIKDYLSAKRYLDSAVSNNISVSVRKRLSSTRYYEIAKYTVEDIRASIEKLVELYNGVFDEEIINRTRFKPVIGVPLENQSKLFSGKKYRKVDTDTLYQEYCDVLNISCTLSKPATAKFVRELDHALSSLGLLSTFETEYLEKNNTKWERAYVKNEKYIIQPAIKYHQLQEAKRLLTNSEQMREFTKDEIIKIKDNITNIINGDITENIIIFDTMNSLNQGRYTDGSEKYIVSKVCFDQEIKGEYDMVVYNTEDNSHYAFEIKHSSQAVFGYNNKGKYIGQDKHLVNVFFKEGAEWYLGKCKGNFVLYNGYGFINPLNTIYLNMVDFLKSIDKTHDVEKTIADLTQSLPRKTELDLIDPNPNIHPFPVAMTGIPLECQKNLHQLILLNYNTTQPECIYTKLKRISPKLSNAINKKDVMEVVRGYKSLSSCKKMSEEFSVSTAGKEFAKQIKREFFQA